MTSSGSVDFDMTQNEIINDALVHIGAIAAGETPSAEDSTFAVRQLNRMVKAWQATGAHLWTRREAIMFLSLSQGRYTLGPNSTDHAAELDDAAFTTLASGAASGASSVTVGSVTNIATSDHIGVVLDDATIDWFTVSSIASTTITLSGTLSGAAASGNAVFAYTTRINRPLRVIAAQRRDTSDNDTPIRIISNEEYQRLPNKTQTGKPNEVYYSSEIPDGFLHVWSEPETSADRLLLTCLFPLEDFDATANTSDFPQEWLDALTWNLAKQLMPGYGVPSDIRAEIRANAKEALDAALAWDVEETSTFFAPAEY